MLPPRRKISLVYFVILTLLLVGMVPLILTGWFLSDKSAKELRSSENRYQIQLVQEKAHQMEMFGKSYGDLVTSISMALELSSDLKILSSQQTEVKLGSALHDNPELLAICVKPMQAESVSVRRSETISNNDVQALSLDAMVTGNERLLIGKPTTLGSNGELAMTFSSPVRINDRI